VAALTALFSIGFFALVAQTLLFRDFLSVYEGNELGIATFFTSWLLWVAAGALCARRCAVRPVRNFEWLVLLYVPAAVLQAVLIQYSRPLAGVSVYELFPFVRMCGVSLLTNAPVSFLTGWLFTRACHYLSAASPLAVARVFVAESAGSFAGGVAVTLLLTAGVAAESIFLYAALCTSAGPCLHAATRRRLVTALVPALLLVLLLAAGVDRQLTRWKDHYLWQRLLPQTPLGGAFVTTQARYLYGSDRGQFNVVAQESVTDVVPAAEHASEVAALHLAQHPTARRILVIGRGAYAICNRFLILPGIESVTLLDPDPDYPGQLLEVLPGFFKTEDSRLRIPRVDARTHLQKTEVRYDLVVLNLPTVTTLALNRTVTREFFDALKARLAPAGVVGARITGGENFMGDDLVNAGASVYHTLTTVFPHVGLKPGDESWLLASEGTALSADPAVLGERFAGIEGSAALYPAAGLSGLYPADRIAYQLSTYRAAADAAPERLLLNTDDRPKALLHSLLFVLRQAGASDRLTLFVRTFAINGVPVLVWTIVLFGVLRFVYTLTAPRSRTPDAGVASVSLFDAMVVVVTTGAVGMATNILLMFMYQSRFGSIFLHIGLITAAFMLGLSVGSAASEQILLRRRRSARGLLAEGLCIHALLLGLLTVTPAELSRPVFGAFFLLSGVMSGIYVPAVAAVFKQAGREDAQAGSVVDCCDHLGGTVGGLLMGLWLLPLFSRNTALGVVVLLLLVNLPGLRPRRRRGGARAAPGLSFVRPGAYVLFGICATAVLGALMLGRGQTIDYTRRLQTAAHLMRPSVPLTMQPGTRGGVTYFTQGNASDEIRAYFFGTDRLAPEVQGYGGPFVLAVMTDPQGILQGVEVLQSDETPAYLSAIRRWMRGLAGAPLFSSDALAGVDAVSGATLTSQAVLRALRKAGHGFASETLALPVGAGPAASSSRWWPDREFAVFALLVALGLFVRNRPRTLTRRVFLIAVVLVCGFWLNLQYSLSQIFALLSLKWPAATPNGAFLFVVLVPLLVLCFGNIYCGYLCPFGALQELIGHLRPARVKLQPDQRMWNWTRLLKYLLLAMLVLLYVGSGNMELASADPLVTVFGTERQTVLIVLIGLILVLSFFYNRFWCRALCPTGAFLALLHGIKGLRRFIPPINPKLCIYGVDTLKDLDCICCDRCRGLTRPELLTLRPVLRVPAGLVRRLALALALVVVGGLFLRDVLARHGMGGGARGAAMSQAAVIRAVDMPKLKQLIDEQRLSDQEALFYEPISEDDDGRSGGTR
jgi:spermidine synthase